MYSGNATSIIVAMTGLVVVQGGALIWLIKWFAKNYGKDMKAHTKAALTSANASTKLTKAVDKNTESSDQMITFMRNLNGKLAKGITDTIHETTALVKEAKK